MTAHFQLTVLRYAKQALSDGDFDSLEQFGFTPDIVYVLQSSSDEQLKAFAEQNPTLFSIRFDMAAAKLATMWRRDHPNASQAEFNAFLDGVQAAKRPAPAG